MASLWQSLLSEFLGTFILVFVGAGAVAATMGQETSVLTSALAFGLILMVLVYVLGPISGSHLNPAVSLGFAVAGRMNFGWMIGYWIAQIIGAIAAAALIAYFFGTANDAGASIGSLTRAGDAWRVILLEAIITFFFVLIFLAVTHNPLLALVSGLIIGAALAADMLVAFNLTGASTNPARSLGSAIFTNNWGSYWYYLVGPLLGALVAAIIYRIAIYDYGYQTVYVDDGNGCQIPAVGPCGNKIKEKRVPELDHCGKPVYDECGVQQFKVTKKYDKKLSHKQETPFSMIGSVMTAHGMHPSHAKQIFEESVPFDTPEKAMGAVKETFQNGQFNLTEFGTPMAEEVVTTESYRSPTSRTSTLRSLGTPLSDVINNTGMRSSRISQLRTNASTML